MKKIVLLLILTFNLVGACTLINSSKFEGVWEAEEDETVHIEIKKLDSDSFDVQFYEGDKAVTGKGTELNGEYKLSDELNSIFKKSDDGGIKITFTDEEKLYIGQKFFVKLKN